jgi:hypothetical protein
MHARRVSGKSLLRSSRLCTVAFLLLVITNGAPALAQDSSTGIVQEFGARTIFFMLFLMLGPVKVLVPFANMTHSCDGGFQAAAGNTCNSVFGSCARNCRRAWPKHA